ncbi:nuclear fragile X mental retardation-interacting protein 2-like [Brienomyrus brachyistius]|uniref:nuclear fragile X mental retardation-interacting protein 2-like n=1 Tax=Brienomyrus brachyistius TaxID=42636 RepID=UPI0020B2907C|nr:nuclear fragile X mental retardation-interacting protein 2-like [Brienomyrus brachyistius]
MEERPGERPSEKRHQHETERGQCGPGKALKDAQSRCEHQHQEAPAKKAGPLEAKRIGPTSDAADVLSYSNGAPLRIEANLQPGQVGRGAAAPPAKTGSRSGPRNNRMECKRDKALDGGALEPMDKEPPFFVNGLAGCTPGYMANGYPGNDAGSSESGYAAPKKRQARFDGARGAEAVQRRGALPVRASEPSSPELGERATGPRTENVGVVAGVAKVAGTSCRRNEDGVSRAKVSPVAAVKEDSWTLFRPLPVFPVDNSSARIVPKISYASKVKENLNRAAPSAVEMLPPQAAGLLAQVPMSAVKTVPSAICGDGGPFAKAQPLPAAAPAYCYPRDPNVASSPDGNAGATPAPSGEQRKPSIVLNPLAVSGLELAPPSASPEDLSVSPADCKALGDIFQNEWGLSFINEPNAGPRGSQSVTDALSQDEALAASDLQAPDNASLPEKRTSGAPPAGLPRGSPSVIPVAKRQAQTLPLGSDPHRTNPGSRGTVPPRDMGVGKLQVDKESGHVKSSFERCSWRLFDLKAAVMYHTKEIGNIFNLLKQDPHRVLVYDESLDGPAQ